MSGVSLLTKLFVENHGTAAIALRFSNALTAFGKSFSLYS